MEFVEVLFGQEVLIQAAVELTLEFRTRALSVLEKADELAVAAGIKSLGDVVHDRARRAQHLVLQ